MILSRDCVPDWMCLFWLVIASMGTATVKLPDTTQIKTTLSSLLPSPFFIGHQPVHVGVRSVVCARTSNQWKLRTAQCPTLGGSHLSADAWSPRQSERSAAGPICSTTGRAVGGLQSLYTRFLFISSLQRIPV